ncbi:hypothetical protein [Natronorubrum bangense]|uniref:Uncharacterized protein n=2 Tax=Natronorubrum bangense TaxID=61858 RepID=L9WQM0_9EURY|nr:hypothetical protein [Natronorubrum bangense]ELY50623.1 hypothetical protein C494_04570 [Natronorubrum bangense JCM 10635]QCC54477.1 hypothetical protein DV706_08250 [Natronorubrum bangense]
MSVDGDRDGRDLEAELESAGAGTVGIPVDAICVGCGRIRVKRSSLEELDQKLHVDPDTLEASDLTSFKHVCHPCKGATWWNPVSVLTGLLESEGGE